MNTFGVASAVCYKDISRVSRACVDIPERNQIPNSILDGDINTKFLSRDGPGTVVAFSMDNTATNCAVLKYYITSSEDSPHRNPQDFKLYGKSSAESTYTLLDTKEGVTWGDLSPHQTQYFDVDESALVGDWDEFLLEVIDTIYDAIGSTASHRYLQFSEFGLYGDCH